MTGPTSAEEVVQLLYSKGIKLEVLGRIIRYAPRSQLDALPDLKALLVEHKDAVIELLTPGDTINGDTISAPRGDGSPPPESGDKNRKTERHGDTNTQDESAESLAASPSCDGIHGEPDDPSSDLDCDTQALIDWFQNEGQHLISSETHRLGRIPISKPEKFKEYLHFQISLGPDEHHWRSGDLRDNLRYLKKHLSPPPTTDVEEN